MRDTITTELVSITFEGEELQAAVTVGLLGERRVELLEGSRLYCTIGHDVELEAALRDLGRVAQCVKQNWTAFKLLAGRHARRIEEATAWVEPHWWHEPTQQHRREIAEFYLQTAVDEVRRECREEWRHAVGELVRDFEVLGSPEGPVVDRRLLTRTVKDQLIDEQSSQRSV